MEFSNLFGAFCVGILGSLVASFIFYKSAPSIKRQEAKMRHQNKESLKRSLATLERERASPNIMFLKLLSELFRALALLFTISGLLSTYLCGHITLHATKPEDVILAFISAASSFLSFFSVFTLFSARSNMYRHLYYEEYKAYILKRIGSEDTET